jgi:hypothetical protein
MKDMDVIAGHLLIHTKMKKHVKDMDEYIALSPEEV